MSENRKQTVYTKTKVFEILEGFANQLTGFKTIKEAREFAASELPKFKPSGRGRRSNLTVNLADLQALVVEEAEKVSGNDGKFLLGMVAAKHNTKAQSAGELIDANRLRTLVEAGKLTLPEQFTLPARQTRNRKPKTEAAS